MILQAGIQLSKRRWVILIGSLLGVALLTWFVLVVFIFKDNAKTYNIDYDLGDMAESFLKTPTKAKAGASVEIRHAVIYDGGIHLYLDGQELERTHNDSDYCGFSFVMPDRDVKITAKPYTKAEIYGGGIEVFSISTGVSIYNYLEGEKPDVDINPFSYLVSQEMFDNYGFGVFKGTDYGTYTSFLLFEENYYFLGESGPLGTMSFAVSDLNGDGNKELWFVFYKESDTPGSQIGYFDAAEKTVTVFNYCNEGNLMVFSENAGILEVWNAKLEKLEYIDLVLAPTEERVGIVTFEDNRFVLKMDSGSSVSTFPSAEKN